MSKFAPHAPSNSNPRATSSTLCQKCLGYGHFTYMCKKTRPYVSRPSRTQLLDDAKLRAKEKEKQKALIESGMPAEFKNKEGVADALLEAREKARREKETNDSPAKKKFRRDDIESSSSSSSSSDSDSDTSDSDSSSSESVASRSSGESRDRRRRRPRVGAHSRSKSRT